MSARATTSQLLARVAGRATIATMPASAATEMPANSIPIPCPIPNRAPSLRLVSKARNLGTSSIRPPMPGMPRAAKTADFVVKSATSDTPPMAIKVRQPWAEGLMETPPPGARTLGRNVARGCDAGRVSGVGGGGRRSQVFQRSECRAVRTGLPRAVSWRSPRHTPRRCRRCGPGCGQAPVARGRASLPRRP